MRYLQLLTLATAAVMPAVAQDYFVDVYIDGSVSSDGSTVLATGVLQYSPGVNCSMCSTAAHTYTQQVSITSPTGRTAYCNNTDPEGAAASVSLQCPAFLAINDELGDYTVTYQPNADCSVIGTFLTTSLSSIISVHQTYVGPPVLVTYYPLGVFECQYGSLACDTGTPVCGLDAVNERLGSTLRLPVRVSVE